MTVFASDNNLALIFNLACSAAVRLISKRTLLSSRKKPIIPPLLHKMFRLSHSQRRRSIQVRQRRRGELLIRYSYKQNLTALSLLRSLKCSSHRTGLG